MPSPLLLAVVYSLGNLCFALALRVLKAALVPTLKGFDKHSIVYLVSRQKTLKRLLRIHRLLGVADCRNHRECEAGRQVDNGAHEIFLRQRTTISSLELLMKTAAIATTSSRTCGGTDVRLCQEPRGKIL
jgi:hypothetical protein